MSYVKGDQLIGNDPIICPYCDKLTDKNKTMLSPKHLKIHGKTLKDVRNEYPNLITMTKLYIDNLKQKGIDQSNKTKKVKCIYHNDDDCSKIIIEVPKTNANYYLCDKCKLAGKENKDGRTKKEAYEKREVKLIEKYGVSNPRYISGVTEKIQKTCDSKYGGVGFASDELAEKSRSTIRNKYGVSNVMKFNDIAKEVGSKMTKEANPERAKKISESHIGLPSKLKGRKYEEIHGKEKAKKLIKEKRISGVKGMTMTPKISAPQKELYEKVKRYYPNAKMEFPFAYIFCLDTAIEDLKICIEYDGSYWHDKEKDADRDKILKDLGWDTIRFEDYVPDDNELMMKINEVLNKRTKK